MVISRFFFTALLMPCIILFLIPASLPAVETSKGAEDSQIIQRTIKIEGSVEKPRVIFILTRARIWKEDPLRKSFFEDIIKPVYPEALLKDFTRFELNKHIIRRR